MRHTTVIGVGDDLAAQFMVAGLAGADVEMEVLRLGGRSGIEAVREGEVDLALAPATSVIKDPEDIEVVPAVALSSWKYPFAQLFLPGGLESSPKRVCYESATQNEADLARIILKEHYGLEPSFERCDDAASESTAAVLVGNDVPTLRLRGLRLDLGQEWYELANYPMVWGVFVMSSGSVSAGIVRSLREMVVRTEKLRGQWADSHDQSTSMRRFFVEDVRLRFDDLVTASISHLIEYAFFYNLTDEIRPFPVATVEIDETDGDPTPLL